MYQGIDLNDIHSNVKVPNDIARKLSVYIAILQTNRPLTKSEQTKLDGILNHMVRIGVIHEDESEKGNFALTLVVSLCSAFLLIAIGFYAYPFYRHYFEVKFEQWSFK